MRKLAAATILLAATLPSAACSHDRTEDGGPMVSRNFSVGNFSKIEIGGNFDVDVRTGTKPSVEVRASEALLERLEVEVHGDELTIKSRRKGWFGSWGSHGKGEIHITVPSLSAATLAGSGAMRIDKVQGDAFDGQIAGSGDLRVGAVAVKQLKLGIAGAGSAEAAGKAERAEYEIAGSGDVKVGGLDAQDVKVSIAGSGNVNGRATRTARVDIAGSGDVDLAGGAKCEVHKAGSGDVRCS